MSKTNEKKEIKKSEADEDLVLKSRWMIRPCELYDAEYSLCTSLKSRFDQYFTYGEMLDCNEWQWDRHACRRWVNDEDYAAAAGIIKHEQNRVAKRLKTFADNNVMKERKVKPPPNWNDPLPQHLLDKQKDSYLAAHMQELMTPYDAPKNSCSIS